MNLKFAISIIKTKKHVHYKAFEDVQNLLYFALKKLGFDTITTDNYYLKDRRYIILSAHWLGHYNEFKVEKLIFKNDTIIFNLEQAGYNFFFDNNYINLLKNYEVWDFDYENAKRINAKYNLNIYKILEIGFVNELQTIMHNNPYDKKDIDVLFVGGLNERRRKILNQLKILGLKVVSLFGSYGTQRDLIIARSKLLLNMHSADFSTATLEKVRIGYYLNNKCAVLSEETSNPSENMLWSQGIAICKYEELAFKALELLNNPGQIAKLQVEGLNFFKKRKMEDYLKKVL